MNKTGIIKITIFLLVSANGMFGQIDLSLPDCLAKVRSSAGASRQIDLVQQTADLNQKVVSRNYWPQASIGGKATWQSDVTSLPIDIPNFMVPTVPQDQYAATLDVSQPIYDGGVTQALKQIRTAESDLKINQLESEILNSERQAIDLFFQMALQKNIIANTTFLKNQLQTSLKQAEDLLEAGVLDKGDVSSIRVKLYEANQKIIEATYHLSTAKKSLANMMQHPDTLFTVVVGRPSDRVKSAALENRPEIKAIMARKDLLLAQSRLNDAKVRPSMGAFINAGYGRPGLNFLANSFDWFALGGVKLTLPIDHFYSKKTEMQNQINELQIESSNLSRKDLLHQFERLEFQYRDEIEKLESWIREDRNIVELREGIQSISDAKWKAGIITTTEYLATVTDLNIAQERLASHENILTKMQALLTNLYSTK
ncbi:MAG: TolC family protein [Saprospiraceae bacterium]|nr:TolC family protein [Saprospiraceae bacterium]